MSVNYEVLSADNLRTPIFNGPGYTIDFDLPANAVINDIKKAPILTFQLDGVTVHPMVPYLSDPNRWYLKLNVEVNDRKISSYKLFASEAKVERAMQEVMNPNIRRRRLNHGRNTLHFEIDEGGGQVFLAEIVIWYHIE